MQSFMALSQALDTTCFIRCPIFISQPPPTNLVGLEHAVRMTLSRRGVTPLR